MVLARQGNLLTSMLPVDEYNEAAQSYELEEIADGTLGTPGNPFSTVQVQRVLIMWQKAK